MSKGQWLDSIAPQRAPRQEHTDEELSTREGVAWLIFLLGVALLIGPLLLTFGAMALDPSAAHQEMPAWATRAMGGGIALALLAALPAVAMAKAREARDRARRG